MRALFSPDLCGSPCAAPATWVHADRPEEFIMALRTFLLKDLSRDRPGRLPDGLTAQRRAWPWAAAAAFVTQTGAAVAVGRRRGRRPGGLPATGAGRGARRAPSRARHCVP
ncbi:hypothetical protein QJS66_21705 [Kocuria rhizophila]|nr:hypothetical protein QJS66_21705 [Kocuria rhizophila]